MVVSIDELLLVHFYKRPKEDQVKIIVEGKPRPLLGEHSTKYGGILHIDYATYDKEVWLSGCDKRKALFCWTCVMFVVEANQWNSSGVRDFRRLEEDLHAHKNSLSHLKGMVDFSLFLKQNLLSVPSPSEISQNNNSIKRNNDVLKRVIDVVCLIASQMSSHHPKNRQCNLLNPGDCIKLLNLIKIYDDLDVVDEAIKLVQNHPKVITDIVTELARTVRQAIINDTKLSTFVSLIISEHRDFMAKSKLSTIVRYVTNGKICESFLGFTNSDVENTDVNFKKHIEDVISELELSNRFLALSTDGGVPSAKYLCDFLLWFRECHPHTLYVPCYFHDFCFVLQQTLSQFPECALFFKNLKSLKAFFQLNSKMCDALLNFIGEEFPDLSTLKLTDSQFLRVLKMHRRKLIRFFRSLAEGVEEWTEDEILKSISYQKILAEYQTVFLLETFYQLFERTAFLSEMLSSCHPDGVFETEVVDSVIQCMKNDEENNFKQLWTLTMAGIIEDDTLSFVESPGEEETQQLYQLFLKITNDATQSIQMRFSCAIKLKFIGIFDCENRDRLVISDYQLKSLSDCESLYFDPKQLEIERTLLIKHGRVLGKKSVSDLLDFFWRKSLHNTLKHMYKLAEFIGTLPCKPVSATIDCEKFDCIKASASFSETIEMDCLSLLSLEYDLLEYLKSKIHFYDEVISRLNATQQPASSDA